MIFALFDLPDGVETGPGNRVVYDLASNKASLGAARVDGQALVWELSTGESSLVTSRHLGKVALSVDVELDPQLEWIVRCDRIDFPPGGVAHLHVHPGPGIRRLLVGELTIEADEHRRTYGPADAWFEGADYPVLATASTTEDTAFVRVLLLPGEWRGRRTIRYLDPADEDKPRLQRAAILLEEPLRL